jgi:hypothetical protein
MTLPAETLKGIVDLARASAGVRLHKIDGEPRKLILEQDNDHEILELPAPLRAHHFAALEDLTEFAQTCKQPTIWHNEAAIRLVIDDGDRREVLNMALHATRAWKALTAMDGPERMGFDQKGFIRLLRLELGCSADQIGVWRKLNWNVRTEAAGEVRKQKESLGRSIEAEVAAGCDLPEDLIVQCSVFQDRSVHYPLSIRLLIELDIQQQRIFVSPDADELANAMDATQAEIEDRITTLLGPDPCPVYYGCP